MVIHARRVRDVTSLSRAAVNIWLIFVTEW